MRRVSKSRTRIAVHPGRKGFDLRQLHWGHCPGARSAEAVAGSGVPGGSFGQQLAAGQQEGACGSAEPGLSLVPAARLGWWWLQPLFSASSRSPVCFCGRGAVNGGLSSTPLGKRNRFLNGVHAQKDSPLFGGISSATHTLWAATKSPEDGGARGLC